MGDLVAVSFLGNEYSVPTPERIRCDHGVQFPQRLSSQGLAVHGRHLSLIISQRNLFLGLRLHQRNNEWSLKLDDLLLSTVSSGRENGKQQLSRFQDRVHGASGELILEKDQNSREIA